jgi:DNA-binding CsgD family transcriptional regulator
MSNPVSSAYFLSLPESKLKELMGAKAAGYFVWAIDVQDPADLSMRQVIGFTYISHVLSSGLIVAAHPADLFYKTTLHNLGFEIAKEAVERTSDDNAPAPYYVMDTRGSKLQEYLSQSFSLLGLPGYEQQESDKNLQITRREKDVVESLIKGYSNYEIAENLFVSEATIKKHLANIFQKLEVKNRTQLIYKYKQTLEA